MYYETKLIDVFDVSSITQLEGVVFKPINTKSDLIKKEDGELYAQPGVIDNIVQLLIRHYIEDKK